MLEPRHSEKRWLYELPLPESRSEGAMWLHWLTRLRWTAIASLAVVVSLTHQTLTVPTVAIPIFVIGAILLVLANGDAARRLSRSEVIPKGSLINHLCLDVTVLTAFFAVSGGPDNPFVVLYLLHIVMGAVMLPAQAMVGFTFFVLGAFLTLMGFHAPLDLTAHFLPAVWIEPLGELAAMGITVLSIAIFTLGMANSLRAQQARLYEAGLPRTQTEEIEKAVTSS